MKNSTVITILCLAFVLASTVCADDSPIRYRHAPRRSRPLPPASVIRPVSANSQERGVVPPSVLPPAKVTLTAPNGVTDDNAGQSKISNIPEPVVAPPVGPTLIRPYGVPSEYSGYQSTYFNSDPLHFGCNGQHYGYTGQPGTYCHDDGSGCASYCPSPGGSHPTKCQIRFAAARSAAISRMSPLGSSMNAFMEAQVANANAAQLMLYDYDFVARRSELTVRGVRELRNMAAGLNGSDNVIRVEATPYAPALANMRRATVLAVLNRLLPGMSMEKRVLVSEPLTRGFDGVDALSVSSQLLELQGIGGGQQSGSSQPASLR